LNEGTHITCPRCNGTGVIRDVESSALHVLRVIQEEAMKENTANVHAQVPVDVATYLLNEKRAEITKMEARLKVEIVLIPNKHIETPHYRLERLRHDDERLSAYRASYVSVDAPAEDNSYLDSKFGPQKVRQEAMVKGVTPTQPAPVAVQSSAVADSRPGQRGRANTSSPAADQLGFFGRLLKMFKRSSHGDSSVASRPGARASASEATASALTRADSGSSSSQRPRDEQRRNSRGGRGRGRGGDREGRDAREKRDAAPTQREGRRDNRNGRPDQRNRDERIGSAEPLSQQAQEIDQNQSGTAQR
ncbi:MAG: ribonuclease E/G, partial [Quisquiliibacterium sp.]